MNCRICAGGRVNGEYRVPEMMNGTREIFDYFECAGCGCLQIVSPPPDIARHYSGGYYSVKAQSKFKRLLQEERIRYLASGKGVLGGMVARFRPPAFNESIAPEGVAKDARILDVGCGNGYYLMSLFEMGFRRLSGIDPYMEESYVRSEPISLDRANVLELKPGESEFDCILMGHTLEHIWEQHETMQRVRELLSPDGVCVLRIPWASSYAWEHYRTDWVQLDAPRHFFLHTDESLRILAESAGLKIERISYDSTAFQFWGSEQYRMGIALYAKNSWNVNPRKSPVALEQIREFELRATELNEQKRGDQITAYLKKAE